MVTQLQLEQEVLGLQKYLPEGVKRWRVHNSEYYETASIDLRVALPGAYYRHHEMARLLTEAGVPILRSTDRQAELRFDLFHVNPRAVYSGAAQNLGNYVITLSSPYPNSSFTDADNKNAEGEVKLQAERPKGFGEMHKLVEVIKKYVQLLKGPQAGQESGGNEGGAEAAQGGGDYKVR